MTQCNTTIRKLHKALEYKLHISHKSKPCSYIAGDTFHYHFKHKLPREIVTFICQNHTSYMNILCGKKCSVFIVKRGVLIVTTMP
jgi:hypothetical protein